jgi:hypothetical protein
VRPYELLLQTKRVRVGASPQALFFVRERMAYRLSRQGCHRRSLDMAVSGIGDPATPFSRVPMPTPADPGTGAVEFTYLSGFPGFIVRASGTIYGGDRRWIFDFTASTT